MSNTPILIKSGDKLTYMGDMEDYFIIWLLEQDEETKLKFKTIIDFDLKIMNIVKPFVNPVQNDSEKL